ncbi:MAG: hypothetical protein M3Z46_08675 [Actinomycetota bacterium]|nr:hypothetical protein [Actinomycetota bacterium]
MSTQAQPADDPSVQQSAQTTTDRLERDITELRVPEPTADVERALIRIGMALPIVGLVIVGVAWYGASGTGYVADQLPYLISGGVGGLALILIGIALFLRYSVTHLIRFGVARVVHEQQAQADRIVEAMGSLEAAIRTANGVAPTAPAQPAANPQHMHTTTGS